MLENSTSHKKIKWDLKTMRMHHDGTTKNSKIQVLQTNIQIKCPFMHHHIWCCIQQVFIPIEQIAHVGILGVNVPIIKIYLAQFDYNNKSQIKHYWKYKNLINSSTFQGRSIIRIQKNECFYIYLISCI
jgi:hypothetical protein